MTRPPLVDVAQLATRYRRSFKIPCLRERVELRPGQAVKLIFGHKERLWVKVEECDYDRVRHTVHYRGRLETPSVVFPGLAAGTPIEFEPRHVCAIETRRDLGGIEAPNPREALLRRALEHLEAAGLHHTMMNAAELCREIRSALRMGDA